ncbi:MAG: putative signal transducing protein [Planctomycetota bacterium]
MTDDLATVATTRTEFEAHALVAVLEDAGIDAVAFGAVRQSLPLDTKFTGVPVQVRRRDLERAHAALAERRETSRDLDWDGVDVGPGPAAEPAGPRRMPALAIAGFVAAVVLAATILLALVVMLLGW